MWDRQLLRKRASHSLFWDSKTGRCMRSSNSGLEARKDVNSPQTTSSTETIKNQKVLGGQVGRDPEHQGKPVQS